MIKMYEAGIIQAINILWRDSGSTFGRQSCLTSSP